MRSVRKLWGATDGSVAPTVALSMIGLIAAGGIAFDYAQMASLDTELQNAADQAALAAASQLDGTPGACERAVAAARTLVSNSSIVSNDGNASGPSVTIAAPSICDGDTGISFDAAASIRFYQDEAKTDPSDDDSNAKFVEVTVDPRKVYYALTPIVGAISSGDMKATAFAGLREAICKMPPLMICNPKPGTPFDPTSLRGVGIQVTGHGNTRSGTGTAVTAWGPGDFGFLDVGGNNATLTKALAFQEVPLDCLAKTDQSVTTGNPQALYDAINTRFDIYDFSSGTGTALAPCFSGSCPAAANVVKDMVKADTQTNGNKCKIHNQGWHLPTNQFSPGPYTGGSGGLTVMDPDGVEAMGLPRDNCHYASFGRACRNVNGTTPANDRVGNGEWARGDYFAKYHPSTRPADAATITRYDTYRWEIANLSIPYDGTTGQRGTAVCSSGAINPGTDRRVLSVAVVENCGALSGSSRDVVIGDWVDMFLVEPTVDSRGNGSVNDSIYMEVIGRSGSGASATTSAQTISKAVPYLIE